VLEIGTFDHGGNLEHHDISAMPVVGDDGTVPGKICVTLLARRSLFRLLQSEEG